MNRPIIFEKPIMSDLNCNIWGCGEVATIQLNVTDILIRFCPKHFQMLKSLIVEIKVGGGK